MKFNSQICTTREQSERLIALGLKKETADMAYLWYGRAEDDTPLLMDKPSIVHQGIMSTHDLPAWSLHRLIEMMPPDRKYEWLTISKNDVFYRCIHFGEEEFIGPDYCGDNLYDSFVIMYEWLIKEGYFNKEYLV